MFSLNFNNGSSFMIAINSLQTVQKRERKQKKLVKYTFETRN